MIHTHTHIYRRTHTHTRARAPRREDKDVVEARVDGDALQVRQHGVPAAPLAVGRVHGQAAHLGAGAEPGEGVWGGWIGRVGVINGDVWMDIYIHSCTYTHIYTHTYKMYIYTYVYALAQLPAGDREAVAGEDVVLPDVVLQLLARAPHEDALLFFGGFEFGVGWGWGV